MNLRQINEINDSISTTFGLLINCILVWLIRTTRIDEMKKYNGILLQICIVDIYLTIATFIVKPIILIDKGMEFFLMNGFFRKTTPFIGQIFYQFWTFALIFSITSVPVTTIFRYKILCLNQPFTTSQQFKYLSVSAFFTTIFCIIIFCTYFCASEEDLLMAEKLTFLRDDDGRVRTTGLLKANSVIIYFHVVWLTVITFGSYAIIIWCNLKIYRHMKRFSVIKNVRVKEVNSQLNRVLTVQAIIPIFTVVLPLSLLVIAMYVGSFNIAVLTSCASLGLSWIPASNSASVLFLVKSYRKRVFNTILCRRRGNLDNSSTRYANSEVGTRRNQVSTTAHNTQY